MDETCIETNSDLGERFPSEAEVRQPMQPLYATELGTIRFKPNHIVKYLVEGYGLASLMGISAFTDEDRVQVAQMLGYSDSGFCGLSYVPEDVKQTVETQVHSPKLDPRDARIATLERQLADVKDHLRKMAGNLFNIHPDSLL